MSLKAKSSSHAQIESNWHVNSFDSVPIKIINNLRDLKRIKPFQQKNHFRNRRLSQIDDTMPLVETEKGLDAMLINGDQSLEVLNQDIVISATLANDFDHFICGDESIIKFDLPLSFNNGELVIHRYSDDFQKMHNKVETVLHIKSDSNSFMLRHKTPPNETENLEAALMRNALLASLPDRLLLNVISGNPTTVIYNPIQDENNFDLNNGAKAIYLYYIPENNYIEVIDLPKKTYLEMKKSLHTSDKFRKTLNKFIEYSSHVFFVLDIFEE